MAGRKKEKKAIEHDPLAWLKEDNASDGEPTETVTAIADEVVENTYFGFFDADEKAADTTIASVEDDVSVAIALGDVLTVKTVAEVKRRICESLQKSSSIMLDSSSLQKIDMAGLQLLYSLQKSLATSQNSIEWENRSPIIDSAAKLAGLSEIIDGVDAGFGFFEESSPTPPPAASADQGFGFF